MTELARQASLQTVKRLPLYLRLVREHAAAGEAYISSAVLARELSVDPIVARKDLAVTGVVGTPRRGFPAMELLASIERFLGWNNVTDAVLCGVGSLGRALLGYTGFKQHGLSIVAAFDVNPAVIGTKERGVRVFDIAKMPALIRRMQIRIGILTVPVSAAQQVADRMVEAGVRGIWDFTPTEIHVPSSVVLQQMDLAVSLAELSHALAVKGG